MEFSKFEEQVFLTTSLIENLTDNELGTGFLMAKPFEGKTKILLFSNKHVFWGKKDWDKPILQKEIQITLHAMQNGNEEIGKRHKFRLIINRQQPGYYDHPNTQIDVACANISSVTSVGIKLHLKAIYVDKFFNFERNQISAGKNVLFIGYPTGFYDEMNFLPILRAGTIASIPSVNFNGTPKILLDAQIFPGSSGSPVFVEMNGYYKLLGIISDGLHKGIDFIETETTCETKMRIPREWIGLGFLYTNETIKEVYDLA